MSGWTITPIRDEGEIGAIVDLDRRSFSMPWPREVFLRAFDDPTDVHIALSRFHGGYGCAGFVCYTTKPGQVEIASLAVAGEARRRGLGTTLVRYALDQAGKHRATVATLHVRVSNKEARRFYERCGFAQWRVRHDYYRKPNEDALIYVLPLDNDAPRSLASGLPVRAVMRDRA